MKTQMKTPGITPGITPVITQMITPRPGITQMTPGITQMTTKMKTEFTAHAKGEDCCSHWLQEITKLRLGQESHHRSSQRRETTLLSAGETRHARRAQHPCLTCDLSLYRVS